MKMRLVVSLAIGFVLPTFGQQKDTVDPQIAQQIRALTMKYDEAFNKNDSAALAALFTEDAVLVTPQGTIYGREAIEKYAVDNYLRWHSNNLVHTVDRLIAVGNEVHAIGKWKCAFQGTHGRSKHANGHYSWALAREGDTWKIREYDGYDEPVGG